MFVLTVHRSSAYAAFWCLGVLALLLAAPSQAQTGESSLNGMGVFGTGLGLHGTDTLTVWGDLVLEQTEVVGEGTLTLRGHRPARIVAHQSTLQKLHVANTTRVMVHGDLRVNQRLTVEQGTLDARPARLTLPNACRIELGIEGKLLGQPKIDVASAKPGQLQPGPQRLEAELPLVLVWPDQGRSRADSRLLFNRQSFGPGRYGEKLTPPPEKQPV